MSDRSSVSIPAALLLALGLAAAGWLAAQGMARLKTQDRYVTVKGSAERIVDADLLVWPLPHTVGGNDLAEVQRHLDANTATIRDFFLKAGFKADEIVVSPPRLEDRWAYAYGDNRPPERYRYSNTVSLRTNSVDKALAALRQSGQLVGRGVMIGEGSQPDFDYTRLNDIKPALIAEVLHSRFAITGALFGGLVLYTTLNTLLPSLVLRQPFDIDPLDAGAPPPHPEDLSPSGNTPPSSPPGLS
jgi:hypothetical protein